MNSKFSRLTKLEFTVKCRWFSSEVLQKHNNNLVNKLPSCPKMSRRTNVIGICGICLCVLLLVATQHRPALIQESSQFTTEVANATVTIAEILASQRARIALEMENFEYPSGRFQVDAEKLSDLTMESNGSPVRSVVITTWRSGSTFLGDILNAMPANFYHYEPLLNWGIKRIRGRPDSDKKALKNLKNLLKCDFSKMGDYLEYGQDHTYLFEHNVRLWNQCKDFPKYCWQPKFLTPYCKLFPLQSMKTVRMNLAVAEKLLEDNR